MITFVTFLPQFGIPPQAVILLQLPQILTHLVESYLD